jgi:hypothetical protein
MSTEGPTVAARLDHRPQRLPIQRIRVRHERARLARGQIQKGWHHVNELNEQTAPRAVRLRQPGHVQEEGDPCAELPESAFLPPKE